MKRISIFILTLIQALAVTTSQAQHIKWNALTAYQRQLVSFVLPDPGTQVWEKAATQTFLQEHSTRSSTYHAIGMLFRNKGTDRENARQLIRAILDLQYNLPGDSLHGVWKTNVYQDRRDLNWREFIGTGIIVAREYFNHVIEPDLMRDIDVALIRAAEGAFERDVPAEYTNIAMMSAFLLDYVGHVTSNPVFTQKGITKAKAILDLFSRHNTFTEYNSPTYYGVNLMALGMWRELGKSSEIREWAQTIEAVLWGDITLFYHAGLKNICGPYTRAYGMDMTRYTALTGLCIAMGLDSSELAPLPQTRDRAFEWAYTPLFALLKVQPPKELLSEFKSFGAPRKVLKKVPFRNWTFQAQALLEHDWMMGAATGMRQRWDQHCPGTVHWSASPNGELGWLLVHGENAAETKIKDRSLHIFLPRSARQQPLRVFVHAPEMQPEEIGTNTWTLPGMKFNIQTPLATPMVEIKDDKRFGQVIEISFAVPDSLATDSAVLVLTPHKTS